jgi:NAD(P)-dependent dehydrogenase (short-subunit alcohol dehydrogenase family)
MEQINSRPMAGRTVLVTGGSGGIGKATALGLARMGAHLAITGRDRGRAEDAAREIRTAGGGQGDVFVADLSSQLEVRRLADGILQSLSRIDVLANNVGGVREVGECWGDRRPIPGMDASSSRWGRRLRRSVPGQAVPEGVDDCNLARILSCFLGDFDVGCRSRFRSFTSAAEIRVDR